MLVGHVTKDGAIAGPRVLEHMVDAVLYFEGDRGHQFRILRAVKNRFGATDEIGVFEMTDRGLAEVANPSALFLAERRGNIAGSAVFAGLEGTRPVLVEVQALLAPNPGGTPRRSVIGWDGGRLSMLLAVLETRGGLRLNATDVYLNIAGGLRVNEPAADLAVAAALASAAFDQPTSPGMVYFGEIGLSGEVRQVAQAEARLKEAAKLGFDAATLPRRVARGNRPLAPPEGLRLEEIGHISDLVARFAPEIGRIDVIVAWRRRSIAADNPAAPLTVGPMAACDDLGRSRRPRRCWRSPALLAFMRGLVREVLGVGAWVGAVVAGVWALPMRPAALRRTGSAHRRLGRSGHLRRRVPGRADRAAADRRAGSARWCAPRRSAALTARWVWYSASSRGAALVILAYIAGRDGDPGGTLAGRRCSRPGRCRSTYAGCRLGARTSCRRTTGPQSARAAGRAARPRPRPCCTPPRKARATGKPPARD